MAQCWLHCNFQMGEEERKISFSFKIFLLLCEVIVVGAILGMAWLMDKTLIVPPLIVAFRMARINIEKKYAVWHFATISTCMLVSTSICSFGVYLSLPISVSLISNIIVGVVFAIITWKIQEVIDMKAEYAKLKETLEQEKVFDADKCTLDELVARCKELRFSEENIQLAIELFIKKTKQSKLADDLCVDEATIRIRKLRLKKKLNN